MQGKKWKVLSALAVLAVGAQFIPMGTAPDPPVDETRTLQARAAASREVQAILQRACADCHSNRTRWPWYSRVAPVSWWLAEHVKDGRNELNFSDWQRQLDRGSERAIRKLNHICDEVQKGKMPLKSYLLLHADARLSAADVTAICAWTESEKQRLAAR